MATNTGLPVSPLSAFGDGWFVRGALNLAAVHAVVVLRPEVAPWFWAAVLTVRVVSVAVQLRRGPRSALLPLVDAAWLVGVVLTVPSTSAILLVPVSAWLFASVVDADRVRVVMASVTVAVCTASFLGDLDVAVTLATHAVLVGGGCAVVIAVTTGRQARRRQDGLSTAVGRLRSRNARLLTTTSEAVYLTTAGGEIIDSNPAARRLVPGEHASLDGAACDRLGLQQGLRSLDCSGGCALLAAGHDRDHEVWQRAAGTERRHLLGRVTPVVDRRGRTVEVLHAFRDISAVRRATEAQTLFLATASHELKTPLTVIKGFASLMQADRVIDEDQRQHMLTTIVARTDELASMVERLLLTGRVGAGMVALENAPTPLVDVLRDRVRALDEVSERHRIRLVTPSAPCPDVIADPEALNVVVDHLIENAVKYSPDGGAVDVGVTITQAHVRVSVSDEGIGMTEEDTVRCFDRFWQGDVGERRRFGGTGVGLFIVERLVDGMFGTVHATSELGRGSTFHLELSRADVADGGAAAPVELDGEQGGMVDTVMTAVGLR